MSKLTEKTIKSLKPDEKKFYVWESIAGRNSGSFGVCVYPSGQKRYIIRVYVNNKRKRFTIGPVQTMSLATARKRGYELANEKTAFAAEHAEPSLAETNDYSMGSAEQMFKHYINQMRAKGQTTYKEVERSFERDVYHHIDRAQPAKEITSHQIACILAEMLERGAVASSNHLRAYLQAAFNVAIKFDNDPANLNKPMRFGVLHNPVTPVPRQKIDNVGKRVLSESELGNFLYDLINGRGFGPQTKYTFLLCLYSGGQRPYEIINNKFEWVNFESELWELKLTKNGRTLILPMSPRFSELVHEARQFFSASPSMIGGRLDAQQPFETNGLSKALTRYCERKGMEKFKPRDLRRTCKTLMTKHKIGTTETRNRLHNHALNDVSNLHYNHYDYFDEKREIVLQWSDFLDGLLKQRG